MSLGRPPRPSPGWESETENLECRVFIGLPYDCRRDATGAGGLSLPICTIICIILSMNVVWDETKRRANLKKHGLDFADAAQVLAGITRTFEDARFEYGEQRFISLCMLRDTVVV